MGVAISLSGNVASAVGELVKQFETLNKAVQAVQMSVNEVAAGMRGLGRVGDAAARSWRDAANSMERAARAARSAGSSMSGGQGGRGYGDEAGARTRRPPTREMLRLGYDPRVAGNGFYLNGPGRSSPGRDLVPVGPAFDHDPTYARSPERGDLTLYQGPGGLARTGVGMNGGLPPIDLPPLDRGMRPPWERPSDHDLALAGMGFGAVGYAGKGVLEQAMEAHIQTEVERAQLRYQGFTDAQIKAADENARRLQGLGIGTTIAGGLHLAKDVMTITQSKDEATNYEALKALAETDTVLKSLHMGSEGAELFKAMQAGELRGVLTDKKTGKFSLEGLQHFLKNVQITAMQFGGRYGPSEILQVERSAGAAGAMIDDDTLFGGMAAIVQSMGAAAAGTGLQSLSQKFTGGKMSQGAAVLLADSGILHLPKDAPHERNALKKWLARKYGTGIGQMMFPPEVMREAKKAAEHPLEFVLDDLLPAADRYNKQHGIVAHDRDELMIQRQQWLTAESSRIPELKLSADVIRNSTLIARDLDALHEAQKRSNTPGGPQPIDIVKQNDPRVQIDAFHAAMNALMEQLGGTVMKDALEVLKNFTAGLNAITDWAKAHPKTADDLIHTAEALTALAIAAGATAGVAMVLGPMITVLRSFGAVAGGAEVGGGIVALGRLAGPLGLVAVGVGLASLAHEVDNAVPLLRTLDDAVAKWARGMLGRAADFMSGIGKMGTPDNQSGLALPGDPGGLQPRKSSFVHPAANNNHGMAYNVIYLDGQPIARVVTELQAKALSRAPASSARFDPRISPIYPGNQLRA